MIRMEARDEIMTALLHKDALFAQYESCARALLECEIDDMTDYITKREQLAIEIDKIDVALQEMYERSESGTVWMEIATNRCDYADVPEGWNDVFEAGQHILGRASRTQELDTRVIQRMKAESEELKKKIAARSNAPKIAKYFSAKGKEDGYMRDKA